MSFASKEGISQDLPKRCIRVVVYAGRNFRRKSEGKVCKAWVTFGTSKKTVTTSVVESNAPNWRVCEDFEFKHGDKLKFKLRDGSTTMGRLSIPIQDAFNIGKAGRWFFVQSPGLKTKICGELHIGCHESSEDAPDAPTPRVETTVTHRSSVCLNSKLDEGWKTRSELNLHRQPNVSSKHITEIVRQAHSPQVRNQNQERVNIPFRQRIMSVPNIFLQTMDDKMFGHGPTIKSIFPNYSGCLGGIRVKVKGLNLGQSASDIRHLKVCGRNCLTSLEFVSSDKIYFTTPAGCGSGCVEIETDEGSTVSEQRFFYVDDSVNKTGWKKQSKTDLNTVRREVDDLRQHCATLEKDVELLRGYMCKLLTVVIKHHPEMLEVGRLEK